MGNHLLPENDGLATRSSGQWVEVKLDYLRRYIEIFTAAMRSKWRLHYIDLMAGPGKNFIRGASRIILGSPLLALTSKNPFQHYYFVEYDAVLADSLKARYLSSPLASSVDLRVGNCNLVVDEVVMALKRHDRNSLNLAFLDPEGFELEWNTVAKLASLQRIDLIINYPQAGLKREMGNELGRSDRTLIDRFFGGKEWRKIYAEATPRELTRKLIDLYQDKLRDLGYQDVVRGDQIPQAEPLMRNTKRAPLYRLIFASKHKRGNDFWVKVTRCDRYGQETLF